MTNTSDVFKHWYEGLMTWKECLKCKKMIRPGLYNVNMNSFQESVTFVCKSYNKETNKC